MSSNNINNNRVTSLTMRVSKFQQANWWYACDWSMIDWWLIDWWLSIPWWCWWAGDVRYWLNVVAYERKTRRNKIKEQEVNKVEFDRLIDLSIRQHAAHYIVSMEKLSRIYSCSAVGNCCRRSLAITDKRCVCYRITSFDWLATAGISIARCMPSIRECTEMLYVCIGGYSLVQCDQCCHAREKTNINRD